MSVVDALLVESPLVRAEMQRLRDLHGVYEAALRLVIARKLIAEHGDDDKYMPTPDEIRKGLEALLGEAAASVAGAVPEAVPA